MKTGFDQEEVANETFGGDSEGRRQGATVCVPGSVAQRGRSGRGAGIGMILLGWMCGVLGLGCVPLKPLETGVDDPASARANTGMNWKPTDDLVGGGGVHRTEIQVRAAGEEHGDHGKHQEP